MTLRNKLKQLQREAGVCRCAACGCWHSTAGSEWTARWAEQQRNYERLLEAATTEELLALQTLLETLQRRTESCPAGTA